MASSPLGHWLKLKFAALPYSNLPAAHSERGFAIRNTKFCAVAHWGTVGAWWPLQPTEDPSDTGVCPVQNLPRNCSAAKCPRDAAGRRTCISCTSPAPAASYAVASNSPPPWLPAELLAAPEAATRPGPAPQHPPALQFTLF